MIVVKSWLEQYLKSKLSDNELIEIFTKTAGFDVDDIRQNIDELIVTAKIVEVLPHPNADKLRIARVTDNQDIYNIVCGAPNIKKDMIVPLAKIGAKIGQDEIKECEIRGEISQGMLCSEHELGLGDDHTGILELSNEYELGKPISHYLDSDTIYDLEITPNRGDCLSHIGISREIAAYKGVLLKKEPISLSMAAQNAQDCLSVNIVDKSLCPRYFARVLKDIKVGPSPVWLRKRLIKLGLTPINNVVDATNYIMFDIGQPLHAFDMDSVGSNIIVRNSKPNETLTALDGVKYSFDGNDIIIADKNKIIAIAGIMGGLESGITDKTRNIILEAAEFNPKSIRKTAKRLNISSDASYRFERGIDPAITEYALNAVTKLIKEISGGNILSGIVSDSSPIDKVIINLEYNKINSILGTTLSKDQIHHYLKYLGFTISQGKCTVPSWRHDINLIEDLAEEVGRVYGYDKIKDLPLEKVDKTAQTSFYFKDFLKEELSNIGYCEVINYPFMSERDIQTLSLSKKDLLEIANPVQIENKFMRVSLIPSLLKNIAINGSFENIKLFEINPVYLKTQEKWMLTMVQVSNSPGEINRYLEMLLKKLDINKDIFKIKTLDKDELKIYKIKKSCVEIAETSIEDLITNSKIKFDNIRLKKNFNVNYRPISKYPALTRDLAFVVNKNINSTNVKNSILKTSDLIINAELFDEFASDKFGQNNKNIAFHLYLQAADKTLTDNEAGDVIRNIVKQIEKEYCAKLRDK